MKFREITLISILFLLITTFIYSPFLIQGKLLVTTGLIHSDLLNQNAPFHWLYAERLKQNQLWLWTDLIGNGFPVFATGQSGGLYPVNLLLFRFLPPLTAFNLNLLIHLFLAGLGVYLYCRYFTLSPSASLLAGVSFTFSGFLTIHLMHIAMVQVISWIPFSLVVLEYFLKRPFRTKWLIVQTLLWAMQALAGHHEILFFTILIEFLYLSLRTIQKAQKNPLTLSGIWGRFFFSGFLALLLATPQILPTVELVLRSPRAQGLTFGEATGYRLPLSHLLTLLRPRAFKFSETVRYSSSTPDAINLWETYLYLGIIPLVLFLIGLLDRKINPQKIKTVWLIILVLSFILALGRTTPLYGLLWKIFPLIRLFKSPTRLLLFCELVLAILAGFGWEACLRGRKESTGTTLLFIIVTALILTDLKINNASIHQFDDPKAWLVPPPTTRLINFDQGSRYHSLGTNQLDYRLIDNLQRKLRYLLPSNYGMFFNLPAASFQAGIFTSEQFRLLRGTPEDKLAWDEDGKLFIVPEAWLKRISFQSVEFILSPFPLKHAELELVGTFAFDQPLPGYLLFSAEGEFHDVKILGVFVYRNHRAWPRVFMVDKTDLVKLEGTAKDSTINISSYLPPQMGRVKIMESTESKLVLELSSPTPSVLIILDLDYPGWQARIDSEVTNIFPTFGAFRGINISPGNHQVSFLYQPRSFRFGIILSTLGILGVLAALLPPTTKLGKKN
jgi:hypothetical protein